MLLAHALTLAKARSYLATLADQAATFEASVDYEQILLQIDSLHGDLIPGITSVPPESRDVLFDLAHAAVEELTEHGIDLLAVELLLDMLTVARAKEIAGDVP